MKNIKAIIFDAYGTLFDVNSAAEKCKDKIGDKWEGFANYWRTTQLEYTWLRSLMNRHKDFWQVTEDSLEKSMKAYEIDSSMRNELLNLYKVLSPFPEVPEVLKRLKEKNYTSFKANFSIKENGIEEKLEPELRIYNQPNIITSEADIKTTFFTDKFITMNTVQNEDYYNIRYQAKPFMLWIWISVLLISLGGLISLLKKRYEK